MSSSSNTMFTDEFRVEQINPDGKKFEKVSRLVCKGILYDVELVVDMNVEMFEVNDGDKLSVALAKHLEGDKASLLDQCDYAMHGVVYKYRHVEGSTVEVHVSHGGLLARLVGDERHLSTLTVDREVYTLVRRINEA